LILVCGGIVSEAKMTETDRQQILSQRAPWFIWTGLAVLVILLVAAFSRAWQTNQSLRNELAVLGPMVTAVSDEQSKLEAQLIYVQSDEYVERWSKTRAKMALPGETLLVTLRNNPTPTPAVAFDAAEAGLAPPAEAPSTEAPSSEAPSTEAPSTEAPAPLSWLQQLLGQ
jgi:hypothetical protein